MNQELPSLSKQVNVDDTWPLSLYLLFTKVGNSLSVGTATIHKRLSYLRYYPQICSTSPCVSPHTILHHFLSVLSEVSSVLRTSLRIFYLFINSPFTPFLSCRVRFHTLSFPSTFIKPHRPRLLLWLFLQSSVQYLPENTVRFLKPEEIKVYNYNRLHLENWTKVGTSLRPNFQRLCLDSNFRSFPLGIHGPSLSFRFSLDIYPRLRFIKVPCNLGLYYESPTLKFRSYLPSILEPDYTTPLDLN